MKSELRTPSYVCLMVSFAFLAGCYADGPKSDHSSSVHLMHEPGMILIDDKLLSLSGKGSAALNCGWVGIREDPAVASSCALNAFARRQPFYVRYNLQGIDSVVSAGLAGDAQGKVYFVEYDSMGWETEGLAKGAEVTDGNQIYTEPCPNPVSLRKTNTGRVTCAKGNPDAGHNIMSPTFDPY